MTPPPARSLVLEAVDLELSGRAVLHGIDLRVDAGAPLGVTGPSGAGKTALCLAAAGVVGPTRGRVRVEGGEGPATIGLVLQTHGLVDGLTAEETVALPLEARALPRAEVASRAAAALASVGLTDHAPRFVEDLSGGERQRVGIARALAQDPVVLVADEPTAELDPDNRARVLELLLAFAGRGGVLVVASDDDEVIAGCARSVRLEDGRVAGGAEDREGDTPRASEHPPEGLRSASGSRAGGGGHARRPVRRRELVTTGTTVGNGASVAPLDEQVDHIRGPAGAPVLLVYGDYECPATRRAFREVEAVERALPEGVRVAFRHFPLTDLHPHALAAACAAEAAALQGRFWEMHQDLLDHQKALTEDDLVAYAVELGLDKGRLDLDRHGAYVARRVARDVASAKASGQVVGTPTLFVDGLLHFGSFDADRLLEGLDEAG